MKIAIGVADNQQNLPKPFVASLISMMTTFRGWSEESKAGHVLDLLMSGVGGTDDARNTIANRAVDEGYDLLFWLDSDMTFPYDCLIRMLQYIEKDGLEAVTGLYTYKTPPYAPHIYRSLNEDTGKYMIPASFPLFEPFKVGAAGFGCLLMKTDVFKRVPRPYFESLYDNGKLVKGEDISFCKVAKMDMLLDPTIRCGHLKTDEYGIEDYLAFNKIEVIDGWASPTEEQKKELGESIGNLFK